MSVLTISQTLLNSTVAALMVQTSAQDRDIVCLHGFTQNRLAMVRDFVAPLATLYRRIWFVDCPGHGMTPVEPGDPSSFFDALVTIAPHFDLFGYSMGGRLALWMLTTHPGVIERAVVVSAHLGITSAQAREERQDSDERLAQRLESLPYTAGLGNQNLELRAFLDEWNRAPLFGDRALTDSDLRLRLMNQPTQLAASLRSYGTGQQPDLTLALQETSTQLFYLFGETDTTYRAMADRARQLTNCEVQMIDQAAHDALHDQPRLVAAAVTEFLR
ncbi:alpha/beta fold hydrolase [Ferrimicrobium sp.]|uniref:alpha/beta fold hydrolase n=2 Tax=Ferrimicrobium sp. TaxID=2926050 RepID=UPI0026057027|nr:alpha/beta fold hydrolase [Ferrimicrobium sp.]